MKMTRKIIALLLCLCLAMTASLALAACGGGDDDGDGDDGNTGCSHVGTLICESCFEPVYEFEAAELDTDEISLGVVLEDVEITIIDEYGIEDNGTVSISFADLLVSIDATTGEISGCGEATVTMTGANTGVENALGVYGIIEDGKLYAYAKGKVPSPSSIEAMDAYLCFDLENAVVSGSASEHLSVIEAVAPDVLAWAEANLLPVLDKALSDEHLDSLSAPVVRLINSFFTVKDNKVSLDFGIIKTWNGAAAANKVSELIDTILGEGTYGGLKTLLTGDELYSLNVGQALDYVKNEMSIDIVALFNSADAFATELMNELGGNMGGVGDAPISAASANAGAAAEPGILASMLMQYYGVTIDELLASEELRAMSVTSAIEAADMTVAEVKSVVSGAFTMLENATLYDLVFQYVMGMETVSADDVEELKAKVDGIADMVGSIVVLDFTVENGVITKTEMNLDLAPVMDMLGYSDVDFAVGGTIIPMAMDSVAEPDADEMSASIGITIDKSGVVMDYCIAIPGTAEVDLACKLVIGYEKAVDAARLAEIKTEINKAPAVITAEMIEKSEDTGYWEGVAVSVDPATGDAILYCYDIYNNDSTCRGVVYVFNVNSLVGVMINDGCGDLLDISYIITNAEWYYGVVVDDLSEDEIEDEQALLEAAVEAAYHSGECYDTEMLSVDIVYDVVANAVYSPVTHSHNLVIDEENSYEPTDCESVGKDVLVCSKCGYESSNFYSWGHTYSTTVVGSLANGYTFTEVCESEGCGAISESTFLCIHGDGFRDMGIEDGTVRLGYTAEEPVTLSFSTDIWTYVRVEVYTAEDEYIDGCYVYADSDSYSTDLEEAGEYVLEITVYHVCEQYASFWISAE